MGNNFNNPWLSVWVRPRKTVRAFLDSAEPEKGMIPIAMLSGIINALNRASVRNLGDDTGLLSIFVVAILGGAFFGIIGLYLGSAIIKITGGWIGGQGEYSELRAAFTRGINVPTVLIGTLWVPELLLFGADMFTSEMPSLAGSPVLYAIYCFFILLELVFGVWGFIISMKSIGEAHRFSAVKAFWSVLIPGGILLGILVVFMLFLSVAL
ncbi:MAG: hypothetical protein K0R57_6482 [Paenibacillaceae bacterium]|jgi:hypothetical protein|nr:hypothetical protein [Paenibacillaceae bacterium]